MTIGFWTDAKLEQLKALASHMSASLIGDQLGCSRNAVIGKLQRLGISKGTPKESRPMPNPKPRGLPWTPRPLLSVEPPSIESKPKQEKTYGPRTIIDLREDTCRWPLWGHALHYRTDERLYCGALANIPGMSYCDEHFKEATRPFYRRQISEDIGT